MFDPGLQNHEYMQFVVTHNCNRACRFCIDHKRGNDEYMSEEALNRGLDFAENKGTKDILLIGGEPTLHPQFRKFCKTVKGRGFNLVVTTNFDDHEPILQNSDLVDSWNFSYYGQKSIPKIAGADITLSGLIFAKGFLNTREKLDCFIDEHEKDYHLKFSTFTVINDYTARNVDPGDWIDELPAERTILFDFICAQIYRGHVIKRYDIVGPDLPTLDSYKCLVDGAVTRNWVDDGCSEVKRSTFLKLEELLPAIVK